MFVLGEGRGVKCESLESGKEVRGVKCILRYIKVLFPASIH